MCAAARSAPGVPDARPSISGPVRILIWSRIHAGGGKLGGAAAAPAVSNATRTIATTAVARGAAATRALDRPPAVLTGHAPSLRRLARRPLTLSIVRPARRSARRPDMAVARESWDARGHEWSDGDDR